MKIAAIIVSSLLAALAALILFIMQPGPSGVVASLRQSDGSEYMVTQTCNWSLEPYTVEFFMRSAAGPWGWCYIDHEAGRWRNVTMTFDAATDTVVVRESGVRRAALDRTRSAFWIDNGSQSRELTAPQNLREPPYPFP